MTKPKNMTPEQEASWKTRKREYNARREVLPEVRAKRREYDLKRRKPKSRRRNFIKLNPTDRYSDPEKRAKIRECQYKYYNSPKGKAKRRELDSKRRSPEGKVRLIAYRSKIQNQSAADQFFILAGAAEQISEALTKKTA